jgi:hypothetical protein
VNRVSFAPRRHDAKTQKEVLKIKGWGFLNIPGGLAPYAALREMKTNPQYRENNYQ